MLSGTGPGDAVPWTFEIDGGMRAGEKTSIPVPSNWQQQGFGHYWYGMDRGPRPADSATYARRFTIPTGWKGKRIRIVFDGVMTDALVSINGTPAGPLHQGGFNRFSHDITALVKPGEANEVSVRVSEASADRDTDIAERHGDYWVFGGIYRPVWLEAVPGQSITHVAVDARANGAFTADVSLGGPTIAGQRTEPPTQRMRVQAQVVDTQGKAFGQPIVAAVPAGGVGTLRLAGVFDAPRLWSAETPNLYHVDVTLFEGDVPLHTVRERFGFRTFELRDGKGLTLNGQRIKMKGVNRHSFRPDTGRALSRADSYADVRLIKSMNMNAARMSHYAPEKSFLEAADELGLYVIDELTGWQHPLPTENGRTLVRSLVQRDVNHPSILLWGNGNEGGWNRELDGDFWLYDPQKRPVLHPWDAFGGIDTRHYVDYAALQKRLNGPTLTMPTEFLHGLFDGGHGSGLDDYWKAMRASPVGAGGFLWNLADEGIARSDQGGRIDTYAAYGPDGIVGPRGEKSPSFDTVRAVWSPIQIETPIIDDRFDGMLRVSNQHDFTSLADVAFAWEWVKFPTPDTSRGTETVLAAGSIDGAPIAAHASGTISIPLATAAGGADALRLTARRGENTILTWVWPTARTASAPAGPDLGPPRVVAQAAEIRLVAGDVSARFDRATGLIADVSKGGNAWEIRGARLVFARAIGPDVKLQWRATTASGDGVYTLPDTMMADIARVNLTTTEADGWSGFRLEVSDDLRNWKKVYEGARTARDEQTYSFSGQMVRAVRVVNLTGVRKTPSIVSVELAGDAARYPRPGNPTGIKLTYGNDVDAATGKPVAWLEAPGAGGLDKARWTLRSDGSLALSYAYRLEGPMLYHGIGFTMPVAAKSSARGLLRGPTPVWQNRLRGPLLGVHEIASPDAGTLPPAARAGYFADPRWLRLDGAGQGLVIASDGAPFLQLGSRLTDFPRTTVAFPTSDIGFLHAIPAMGTKGQHAATTGPAGEPAIAAGTYAGQLIFSF